MMSVTRAELTILRVLWSEGQASIRDLADQLYRGSGASGRATVQKLLDRLAEKGFVARHRKGRSYVYRPSIDRGELILHGLRETADSFCGGSMSPLITQLVKAEAFSKADIAQLRELVDRLEAVDQQGDS